VACYYRVSAAVLHCLVAAFPQALAEPVGHPERDDNQGRYPLHVLCDYGCDDADSLLALLRTDEGLAVLHKLDPTFYRTPLGILNERKNIHGFDRMLQRLRAERSRSPTAYGGALNEASKLELLHASQEVREDVVWQKACWLVLAEYLGQPLTKADGINNDAVLLQAFVTSAHCPPCWQECAILLYADYLQSSRNPRGQLVLHVAAAQQSWSLLAQILNLCPDATRFRDGDDRLPLQIADAEAKQRAQRGATSWATMQQLLVAHPAALNDLSAWPLQLHVKVWVRLLTRSRRSADKICCLETLFQAIQTAPDALFAR
jgi:hypothetical protein